MKRYIREDNKGIIETCSDIRTLAKLFSECYSASSFAYVFDFTNGCVDICETDARSDGWHFFFKSKGTDLATL